MGVSFGTIIYEVKIINCKLLTLYLECTADLRCGYCV